MFKATVRAAAPDGTIAALLAAKGIAVEPLDGAPEKCDRFVLSRRIAVDRRATSDFLRAIGDKRLFVHARDLSDNFPVPVIVIEGEDLYGVRAFHPNAIHGAISALIVQYGCSVLRTGSEAETAALIAVMATHEQEGVPEISLHPKRKALSLPDMQRRVVEMLPGVGLATARALLGRFGSVRRIANCSAEELRSVKGIGERKAREILNVLRADYASIDTESDLENAVDYDPSILFRRPVVRIARQHVVADWMRAPEDASRRRWVPDLVFRSDARKEVYVVELKRDALTDAHFRQLRDYLDRAEQSALLAGLLREGYRIRGILASPGEARITLRDPRIEVRTLPCERIIAALSEMRRGAAR